MEKPLYIKPKMIVFYLNDIRKSFYMLSLYFSLTEKESIKEFSIVYSNKNSKFSLEYLNNLKLAFINLNFVSIEDFLINKNSSVELFFYDLDFYTPADIERISRIKIFKKILILNNNVGIPSQEISSFNLKPKKYLVWNHEFISHLIKSRNSKIILNSKNTIYYKDHLSKVSMINHEKIDILFFLPTRLSFKNEFETGLFLDDLSLYLKINKNEVFFKPHQRAIDNYLIPNSKIILILSKVVSRFPTYLISLLSKLVSSNNIIKFLNYSKFAKISRKYKFKHLKFPLIPIEFYLTFIKDEIIGGFSNTLIISSYFDIHSTLFGSKTIPCNFIKRGKVVESSQYLQTNMNFFKNDQNNYMFSKKAFSVNKNLNYIILFNLIKELTND